MVSVEQKKLIKAANDIVDVVASYLPVMAAGKDYKAICPFHNDTRPSLQLSRTYQNYRCWACDARGDVFDFVMKQERVEFVEALRMLADRAGIALTASTDPREEARSRLVRVMKWAEEIYTRCLMDNTLAEAARTYLGERNLAGATVRQFGLGFAPASGDWLVEQAHKQKIATELLEEVGLLAQRDQGRGHYDRFRDRVMFPIRDIRGQTVGFGGRILPSSPYAVRGPKYYNSAETVLFKKSELIYGLDLARHPAAEIGHLAVVEGYTDVMMAHQCGLKNVVATMGTALTSTHVRQLRRYAPKVVLVYDADAGGMGGVDRALELFIAEDIELGIAELPDGLDPCDLLLQPGGTERLTTALHTAVDALEFKLNQLLSREQSGSVESTRRIVDAVLGIMALAPPIPSQARQIRQELMVTRISHRLKLRQETVWARLAELRALRAEERERERDREAEQDRFRPPETETTPPISRDANTATTPRPQAFQAAIERQLLEVLLAKPDLVPQAYRDLPASRLQHSGLQRMLTELYSLLEAGSPADMDGLRIRLLDRPDLLESALKLKTVGHSMKEPEDWLKRIVARFNQLDVEQATRQLKDQLAAPTTDDATVLALLKQLQHRGQPSHAP
jgi:DNA primase